MKPTWLIAATSPVIWSRPTAGRHFSPITNRTRSEANRASATPNGIAHIRASRLAFTNDSRSSSTRFWIAQIAGYRVLPITSSMRVVKAVIVAANETAPAPARPRCALVAIIVALASTTLATVVTRIGPENDA